MLDTPCVVNLKTLGGEMVELSVNYSPKIKDCTYIKLKVGEKEVELPKDGLVTFLLAIGSETDINKLLPCKVNRVRELERLLTFEWKATRDYRQGEVIRVKAPWIDTIQDTEEVFAGSLKRGVKKVLKFFK